MKLFEPGKVGNLSIKNRIVMAPIGVRGFMEADGSMSQAGIDYYVARARGGVGLIISGGMMVGTLRKGNARKPWMENLSESVHHYGTKMALQLGCGVGRPGAPRSQAGGVGASHNELVGPSAVPNFWDPTVIHRELTTGEIEGFIEAFESSARAAKNAGIDAIDIHGHSGYLIDMFMTEIWNQRTDKYGGSLEGRLRLPLDIVAAIKRGAGADFPVIYRFGLTHYFKGGREIEEGLEIARRLEAAGVDALDIDAGAYETHYWAHTSTYSEPGNLLNLAAMTKKAVKIPVMAVGKLQYPALAEAALQQGQADFIMLAKQLLADPEWPNKVKEGKLEDIRPCIGDLECVRTAREQGCSKCTVNPISGNEKKYAILPADRKKEVLVVGGGPGGLEAARVAALRGHKVTLLEKGKALGGNLIPAAVPDFKQDYRRLIDYFGVQLKKLGVTVEPGKEATPELVRKMKPDVLFIATGATPIIPDITGIGKKHVVTSTDLLLGKKKTGERVVVIGGGIVGAETALHLGQKGKKVTVIARHDICKDMFWGSRVHLLKVLADATVEILTFTQVSEITDTGVNIVDKDGKRRTLPAETVVIAVGLSPDKDLAAALKDSAAEVYTIGDCVDARDVKSAIWEAFGAARST